MTVDDVGAFLGGIMPQQRQEDSAGAGLIGGEGWQSSVRARLRYSDVEEIGIADNAFRQDQI
jgi:hypothetical protein